ncbi:MAG TPA: hypothetical protein VN655_02330 [Pseudolabrys sp.]|jgi:hypothetical protein|nr:hypothetical protein [Pseudolabrys sp.]
MNNFALGAAAIILIASATGMLVYEAARARSKRPIFGGRETITLYWVAYLTLYVLGATSGLAAIVR